MAVSDSPAPEEGRPRMAGLFRFFRQRPVTAVLLIYALDILFVIAVQAVAKALLPNVNTGFVGIIAVSILVAAFLAVLGWGHAIGFTPVAEWKDMRLYWLPAFVLIVPPLVAGIKPLEPAHLAYLLVGYLLTGFAEETFYRGILLRILEPLGAVRSTTLAAVLFGIAT